MAKSILKRKEKKKMTEIIVAIIGLIGLIAQSLISANTSRKIKSNEAREKESYNELSKNRRNVNSLCFNGSREIK